MEQKFQKKIVNQVNTSLTVKMIIVGLLTLILLIPLSYIESLINERQHRQKDVIEDINTKWGEEVLLYGPILKVPYITYTEVIKTDSETKLSYTEKTAHKSFVYISPKELNVRAELTPEIKSYGIYKSVVYYSTVHLSGNFSMPDIKKLGISYSQLQWSKSRIIIRTSNLKGVSNQVKIAINNHDYPFSPVYSRENNSSQNHNIKKQIKLNSLESTTLDGVDITGAFSFSMDINYNGSEQFQIIPIGQKTQMEAKSTWKDPSFTGAYLPYNKDKQLTNGFDAKWKVLNINRPFPQSFINRLPNLNEYAFGVNLMIPVNQYQQSTRSAKYGYLVIALTFLIFFLFQSISKINIHPFQYIMIGLALVMFYILLISISEHSSFLAAYIIAAISVIVLIGLYSRSILKSGKFSIFITISLTTLYSFIYIIIQLENYALLVGSIGLFLILAAVMFASRKIDWGTT